MSNSLASRLLKAAGKNEHATIMSESKVDYKEVVATTPVPIVNLMLSGHLDGGIVPGMQQLCGPSRHFKTMCALLMAKSYMDKFPDAVLIFGDSEMGAMKAFEVYGIDTTRVVHLPMTTVEQATVEFAKIIDDIQKDDHVFILLDSLSNLGSTSEVENALAGDLKADVGRRAKACAAFGRTVNSTVLSLKKIPFVLINSAYDPIGQGPGAESIPGGGAKIFLSCDAIYQISRAKSKDNKEDTKEVTGYKFTYKPLKSRFVKEGAKFELYVDFKHGIYKWSGLFDLAKECGIIISPSMGWYSINLLGYDKEQKLRKSVIDGDDKFFEQLIKNETFKEYCFQKFSLESGHMFQEETIDPSTGEIIKLID